MSKSEQMLHECPYTVCKEKQLQAELATAKRKIETLEAEVKIQKSEAEISKQKRLQFQHTSLEHYGIVAVKLATANTDKQELCSEAIKQNEIACRLRDKLLEHRWIPVAEGLPERDVYVLWLFESGGMVWENIDHDADEANVAFFLSGYHNSGPITHWRPIHLPKGE